MRKNQLINNCLDANPVRTWEVCASFKNFRETKEKTAFSPSPMRIPSCAAKKTRHNHPHWDAKNPSAHVRAATRNRSKRHRISIFGVLGPFGYIPWLVLVGSPRSNVTGLMRKLCRDRRKRFDVKKLTQPLPSSVAKRLKLTSSGKRPRRVIARTAPRS